MEWMIEENSKIHAGGLLNWPVRKYSHKTAIIYKKKRITFQEVNGRINRLANGLKDLGLKQGAHIATLIPNSPEYIEVRFGLQKAGMVEVRLNTRESAQEWAYMVNHSDSIALILDRDFLQKWNSVSSQCSEVPYTIAIPSGEEGTFSYENILSLSSPKEPEIMVSLDSIRRIVYTSGTTGKPKGVIKLVRQDLARLRNDFMNQDQFISSTDTCLNVAPLSHAAGHIFTTYYIKGATNVILRKFDPEEILQTIQNEKATAMLLVPTMITRLITHPNIRDYDLSSLRRIYYGTAPIPEKNLKQAIDIFGSIFRQNYGLTEATQPIIFLPPEDHVIDGNPVRVKRLASAGRPALGVEVRLVNDAGEEVLPEEDGEILIRSDVVMAGYWKDPEATSGALRDGWFHTGDMARMDEDGYIFIVDRKKDMIISGGFNIYPREVEKAIEMHPDVLEVAVIGVPDDVWGESVKALIVPKDGAEISEQEIIDHCKSLIASYKKPKFVEFVKELPKNTTGKILKRELKERHWAGLARRV